MTLDEMRKLFFEDPNDEYIRFERFKDPPHKRPDMAAFILLDRLVPDTDDIVCGAQHEVIWLGVDLDALARAASEDDILNLIRCGVHYDSSNECLAMFV